MIYYTKIKSARNEGILAHFLESLGKTESIQNLITQFKFIINKEPIADYWLAFNNVNLKLWVLQDISISNSDNVEFDVFLEKIRTEISLQIQKQIVDKPQPKISAENIQGIETYVIGLLRKHTEYLLSELALTQFPPDTLRKKTEQFINEKLK